MLRLDRLVVQKGLVSTRSQAESYIRLGHVQVDGRVVTKPGKMTRMESVIKLNVAEQYVSRAGLKLASVAESLGLEFWGATVLDVGSSTGGFTQFSLLRGAHKVIAVDVGTNQMHPSLRTDPRIELHEQTDIRGFVRGPSSHKRIASGVDVRERTSHVDIVLIDVSFISLQEILPSIEKLITKDTLVVAMVKPQFEAGNSHTKHKGVIKNEKLRREVLVEFERYASRKFKIINKSDSGVKGEKGNTERFYLLRRFK